MLKRRTIKHSNETKVTFVLDHRDSRLPASVVGDFNNWNPGEDLFVRRSNRTASVVISLQRGHTYRFRYRSEAGEWFNDEAADGYEPNAHGSTDCIIKV